jgi:hypothetical protein
LAAEVYRKIGMLLQLAENSALPRKVSTSFEPALYLLEVKSAEWFDNGKGQLKDKICDLFRCYFDSLTTLVRSKDEAIADFRKAAVNGRIKLVLFPSQRLPGDHNLMALMDGMRIRLAKKLRHLDVQPEIL